MPTEPGRALPGGGTTTTDPEETDVRLDEAERRIDEIGELAKGARIDTRLRVERRVAALEALTREVRSKLSGSTGVGIRAGREDTLNNLLEEIEAQIEIAGTQLELDAVEDGGAFATVAERQIAAYRAYAQVLERGAAQRRLGADAMLASIRSAAAAATLHLQRLRELSNEVSASLRAGVLAALDELDRAAIRTSATGGEPAEKGGAR